MKKTLTVLALLVLLSLLLVGCTVGGGAGGDAYTITENKELSHTFSIGTTNVDFTTFFTITDKSGEVIPVTEEMLDLRLVDFSGEGTFTVTLTYKGQKCTATFTVQKDPGPDPGPEPDLAKVLAAYLDSIGCYSVNYTISVGGNTASSFFCGFNAGSAVYSYAVGDSDYTDYLFYDETAGTYTYYSQVGFGEYEAISGAVSPMLYDECAGGLPYLGLAQDLSSLVFSEKPEVLGGAYVYTAADPAAAGNLILGEYEEAAWTYFSLYVADGKISRIRAINREGDDTYTYVVEFVSYDDVTLPAESSLTVVTPAIADKFCGTFRNEDGSFTLAVAADGVTFGGKAVAYVYSDSYGYVWFTAGGVEYLFAYDEEGFFCVDESGNFYALTNGSDPTPTPEKTYTSVFTDENLTTSGVAYTASVSPFGYSDKGVQFTQANGEAILLSASSFEKVNKVVLSLATNCPTGMKVRVFVGTTEFTSADLSDGLFAQSSALKEVSFTGTAAAGQVKIVLTPTATKKSMYIQSVAVTAGGSSSGGSDTPAGGMMEAQDPTVKDNDRLQDKMLVTDSAIGLPSKGGYHCLVIPVQFTGTTLSAAQLAKLEKAFNGTAADTGWESVASYYRTASRGNLDLTFDIQAPFVPAHDAAYYKSYSGTITVDGETYQSDGSEQLLLEALAYYESRLDLTIYDTNGDSCIDAVYLIYSAPVEYDADDSFYWAYVTTTVADTTYDGVYPYYYLFAGFDFMDEDTAGGTEIYGTYPNLNINASTYIHETGHLLGLDDYYDTDDSKGSGEGLGGAAMMDNTVGELDSYSRIMLGWITPTIVSADGDFTLTPTAENGGVLLLMLDFDGSYFSEYLLIDLYANTGLNRLHSEGRNSLLYGGAAYGIRIYHISSSIRNPYGNEDYWSYTDYNNSTTDISLIRLVEADGEKKFASGNGYATKDDLWQTGDVFSAVWPTYTRNDGKTLNFDLTFTAVSADGAAISVAFCT